MNKVVRITLQLGLLIVAIILAYFLVESIMQPIRFDEAYRRQYEMVKQRLIEIRDVQVAFKYNHGNYTADFDSLIAFAKNDSMKVIKASGSVPDSIYLQFGRVKGEEEALKLGIIKRDTVKISVLDSLFKPHHVVDSLKYVPNTGGKLIELETNILATMSGVNVSVFEARVHNNVFLKHLDRQAVINLNDEAKQNKKYPGLKVGSIIEVTNNSGNWD